MASDAPISPPSTCDENTKQKVRQLFRVTSLVFDRRRGDAIVTSLATRSASDRGSPSATNSLIRPA